MFTDFIQHSTVQYQRGADNGDAPVTICAETKQKRKTCMHRFAAGQRVGLKAVHSDTMIPSARAGVESLGACWEFTARGFPAVNHSRVTQLRALPVPRSGLLGLGPKAFSRK